MSYGLLFLVERNYFLNIAITHGFSSVHELKKGVAAKIKEYILIIIKAIDKLSF